LYGHVFAKTAYLKMTISKFADRVRATGSDDSDFGVRLQPLKTPIQAARNPGNEQLTVPRRIAALPHRG
jgi:hypothetical protein